MKLKNGLATLLLVISACEQKISEPIQNGVLYNGVPYEVRCFEDCFGNKGMIATLSFKGYNEDFYSHGNRLVNPVDSYEIRDKRIKEQLDKYFTQCANK